MKQEPRWLTICCISPYTELELLKRSRRPVEQLIDADEAELGLFTDHSRTVAYGDEITTEDRRKLRRCDIEENPHACCRDMLDHLEDYPRLSKGEFEFLPASLLGVCRQIYTEANPIMWSTNTFSFADAEDFKNFMHGRTAGQKATISKLRFDINWDYGGQSTWEWQTHANQLGFIRSLRGLRSLYLHAEQDYATLAREVEQNLSSTFWTWCYGHIARIRMLPLQDVILVLSNSQHAKGNDILSQEERIAIAERVRKQLLDPGC